MPKKVRIVRKKSAEFGAESARATVLAAESAARALNADRAMLAMRRPIVNISVKGDEAGEFDEINCTALVRWENFGKLPAINVGTTIKLAPTFEGEELIGIAPAHQRQWVTLAAGEIIDTEAYRLPKEVIQQFFAGITDLYLYSSVAFEDVAFPGEIITEHVLYKIVVDEIPFPGKYRWADVGLKLYATER